LGLDLDAIASRGARNDDDADDNDARERRE